jgi:hypothetical protein
MIDKFTVWVDDFDADRLLGMDESPSQRALNKNGADKASSQ